MKNLKVAIVTGSSSGIGYETALVLARNGFRTYATMRKYFLLQHWFPYFQSYLL